ncbi:MAG: antibiotic biosynthesis monooxygenase [Chloroflexi bacterium]|nr:antibiotic biosynthesis monooxygenase [Chloroflexota bacterium]MDA1218681.1 antibiotic biosynthesis monooxygenase [Chloroflexota bacterium]PKB57770.1 MAG: hypothetical protein BZY73_01380 [SAR202 cluster bacterium Casp-Chloro-G3]
MSDIVSWVVDVTIKPGELANFKALAGELVRATQTNEPDTLAYEYLLSEDNSVCHIYERYADSDAAKIHLTTFGERFAKRFMGMVNLNRLTVYGSPDEGLRKELDGLGATFMPQFNGFAR